MKLRRFLLFVLINGIHYVFSLNYGVHRSSSCINVRGINNRNELPHASSFDVRHSIYMNIDKPGMKGYYVRPSRAIEKGGGFFVPGLEDQKIRVLAGALIVLFTILNHIGITFVYPQFIISEILSITMGLYMLSFGIKLDSSSTVNYADELTILQTRGTDKVLIDCEYIAREILKTVDSVTNVIAINTSKILVEIGPITKRPIGETDVEDIYKRLVADDTTSTNPTIDLNLLSGRIQTLNLMPSNKHHAVLFNSKGGVKWIIVSSSIQSLMENQAWINSLISLEDTLNTES